MADDADDVLFDVGTPLGFRVRVTRPYLQVVKKRDPEVAVLEDNPFTCANAVLQQCEGGGFLALPEGELRETLASFSCKSFQ